VLTSTLAKFDRNLYNQDVSKEA